MSYSNKKVLVLGLGESGLAAAHWLVRCGAVLRVADTREAPERLAQLMDIAPQCEFISGKFSPALLDDIDFIVASPGLSENNELAEIAPIAAQRAIPVWSEIEIFAQSLLHLREAQNYQPKVLAITGTNGKTTVTSLVGLLVERAGKSVRIAGNISPAVLDVLRIALDENRLPEVWVLELSSFQLHSTYSLQADAATVLNLTQDHLDWHGSMEAYAADKARIFSEHTVQVLNRDDSAVMGMQTLATEQFTFGQSAPKRPGEFGLHSEHGMNWLCVANAVEDEAAPTKRKLKNQIAVEVEVHVARLMPADALKIRGNHNATNALAALALCRAIDLPLAPLLHGLREYQGEPHRVELIATIDQVDYYDDSKGTNVGATVAAINGLASAHSKILLIAGGAGKGQNFTPLHDPVAKSVAAVFLIGEASDEIALALDSSGAELVRCASMEQAVSEAAAMARSGDMVLLSPACASFDMFKNYAHRAQVFIDAVKEVGYTRGEVGL
ncbi:UDP-N-acetylmuramoyl-L-alanine--D-glutamate ligase [Solimicrobium silvestre]|uniref:UDP-N-acetylmuramoylalanine--D-glutamate ligase n=1 Tax=Solimicrobium silvestre TaxID=2099400 RepID=A0A2S9H5P9_9BURK|nr:UDP-N-acetylmuramoyl-L-alanine--D-glutamate ligase [Solimicrobium silvestre]PRC95206.1 murD: UDP-N-acetylmuramoylalanine--D-glutamate ligase [Solimicrobium silvestre]